MKGRETARQGQGNEEDAAGEDMIGASCGKERGAEGLTRLKRGQEVKLRMECLVKWCKMPRYQVHGHGHGHGQKWGGLEREKETASNTYNVT